MSAYQDIYNKSVSNAEELTPIEFCLIKFGVFGTAGEEEKAIEAAEELAVLRERVEALEAAVLASGKLLADAKAYLESEIKACGGIGMEHEIGLVDSIDAWQDLHGETTAALARLDNRPAKV